jgi:hypothetical protein
MITLPGANDTALASSTVGDAWLLEMAFTSGTQRVTNWTSPIMPSSGALSGLTFTALGSLLGIGAVSESEDPAPQKLDITLPLANAAWLALTLGSVETYRGKVARLYMIPIDSAFQPVGTPQLRFTGTMNPVKISRDKPALTGGTRGGKLTLPLSRLGMSRSRNEDGLRRTHQQQQALYSTDRGLEYTVTLRNQPSTWLSVKFQAAGL